MKRARHRGILDCLENFFRQLNLKLTPSLGVQEKSYEILHQKDAKATSKDYISTGYVPRSDYIKTHVIHPSYIEVTLVITSHLNRLLATLEQGSSTSDTAKQQAETSFHCMDL